jgi:hypothetical protein
VTLLVASRRIDRLHALSEHGRLVLGLIEGGRQWLDWAVDDPRARYHFEDENALVAGIQSGLHAYRLVLLPRLGLLVSPVKLMTLSVTDLRRVIKAERRVGAMAAAAVKRIFAAHDLVTADELAEGLSFLEELEVANAPLFCGMALDEQLAIRDLLRLPDEHDPTEYQDEAAAFALEQSRTPIEFADYYRAYPRLIAGRKSDESKQDRKERAEAALATLIPILFNALDCPRVDGPAPAWEVSAAIEEWLLMGRRLGFSRLSQGVQQISEHAGYEGQEDEEAERIVGTYLAGAQTLLMSTPLGDGQVRQDGTCAFAARSAKDEVIVVARPNGIITLSSYRRLPNEPAGSATTRGSKHHGKA